jgi:hypothetical protein
MLPLAMGASIMIRQGENRQTDPAKHWFDHTNAQALHTSFATLEAGCRYLIARAAQTRPAPSPLKPQVLMRVSQPSEGTRPVLLAADQRISRIPAGDGAQAYRRAPADLHPLDKHRPRLRAIRRLQVVACDQPVRNHCALTARDLAMASLGVAGGKQAAGQPFLLDDQALAEIARFYLTLAGEVIGLG